MSLRRLEFRKLDAFTDGPSGGNPAGLVLLREEQTLSDGEMQQVASELGAFVSEVAFAHLQEHGISLRYFSRDCEVPFCGHATLATADYLFEHEPHYRDGSALRLETPRGSLLAHHYRENGGCTFIEAPRWRDDGIRVSVEEAGRALDMPTAALGAASPSATKQAPLVECGLRSVLLPAASLRNVLTCTPQPERLASFLRTHGADVLVLYTTETALPACALRTRVFCPTFGYLEDPATGSGNAALAGWLRQQGLWDGEVLSLEQGPDGANPNRVTIRRGQDGGLMIGGSAVVRIEGDYLLHRHRGGLRGMLPRAN